VLRPKHARHTSGLSDRTCRYPEPHPARLAADHGQADVDKGKGKKNTPSPFPPFPFSLVPSPFSFSFPGRPFSTKHPTTALPWAILPEVDYLVGAHLGAKPRRRGVTISPKARFTSIGPERDLSRARQIAQQYRALRLGLVDTVVIATAERLKAEAIATLDVRHFGAVRITGSPRLLPRDR
jgi:hypothetical protein